MTLKPDPLIGSTLTKPKRNHEHPSYLYILHPNILSLKVDYASLGSFQLLLILYIIYYIRYRYSIRYKIGHGGFSACV